MNDLEHINVNSYESIIDVYGSGSIKLIRMPLWLENILKEIIGYDYLISKENIQRFIQLVEGLLKKDITLGYTLISTINEGIFYAEPTLVPTFIEKLEKNTEQLVRAWSSDYEIVQIINDYSSRIIWGISPYSHFIDPLYIYPKDQKERSKDNTSRAWRWYFPDPNPEQYGYFPIKIKEEFYKKNFTKTYRDISNNIREEFEQTHKCGKDLKLSVPEKFYKEKIFSNPEWMKILEEKFKEYLDFLSNPEVVLTSDCEIERELTRRILDNV